MKNVGTHLMTLESAAQAAKASKKPSRGKRITIDSVLYVLKMSGDPAGATLNKLARARYGNYRDASTVVNRLVQCGMIIERITRDERQIPRVSFAITEKGQAVLRVFEGWQPWCGG
jgi:predicted transcriptional regulator